jgi:hypothetical protein
LGQQQKKLKKIFRAFSVSQERAARERKKIDKKKECFDHDFLDEAEEKTKTARRKRAREREKRNCSRFMAKN